MGKGESLIKTITHKGVYGKVKHVEVNSNKPYNVIKMQYELRTGFASYDKNGKTVVYMEEVSDNGQINTGGKSGA